MSFIESREAWLREHDPRDRDLAEELFEILQDMGLLQELIGQESPIGDLAPALRIPAVLEMGVQLGRSTESVNGS